MHKSVEVVYKKIDECPVADLQLTFFQMAYVIAGEGKLRINGNCMPYKAGNLMLQAPNDYYAFDIDTPTEFLLIRFNSGYIRQYQWESIDHIECMLFYASHLSGCIMNSESDSRHVKSIVEVLLYEMNHGSMYNEDLTRHFVNALIVIAARNIAMIKPANIRSNADNRIQDIINYIQLNIRFPQKLKASAIAEAFGLSDTYLGAYFKNQCGETIQYFIANYKIRLIEHRLRFSDMRINEIAGEFGFADESHLNKFFKKYQGQSLTAYRKANFEKGYQLL
ncbi:helix-turn-helix transcriptional regulator [Chitinophaga agrisoli]|uniref:Helix-turn-helix transcriptional regulator n=1 Tax=Chitinophaga agrisoli TaxID=2607653 RepID=A0A5B2W4A5_9BACT|nr:AraC family transcriptional regulator [Chitinophaga agrisoli]KAA2245688.1 helix-turn-helix transcriptional regulator [Chitinophaga agrisoli]